MTPTPTDDGKVHVVGKGWVVTPGKPVRTKCGKDMIQHVATGEALKTVEPKEKRCNVCLIRAGVIP